MKDAHSLRTYKFRTFNLKVLSKLKTSPCLRILSGWEGGCVGSPAAVQPHAVLHKNWFIINTAYFCHVPTLLRFQYYPYKIEGKSLCIFDFYFHKNCNSIKLSSRNFYFLFISYVLLNLLLTYIFCNNF